MKHEPYRHSLVEINLSTLSSNMGKIQNLINPSTAVMAVIKADAYGHGAAEIARRLMEEKQADYLGVAVIDEALELREAGITLPVLLLSPLETVNIPVAIENDITLTVFTKEAAASIKKEAERLGRTALVHLKVDTGMSRIGVQSNEEAEAVLEELVSSQINVEGIYTHFADSDNVEDSSYTVFQYEKFKEVFTYLEEKGHQFKFKHCCNTAAMILFPDYHLDMVRTGIGMLGYYPVGAMEDTLGLTPILTFKAYLAHTKVVEPGTSIGYGRTYTVQTPMKVGTVIIGYADGLPRSLSNKGHFTLNGRKAPIVGRVCMDQTMIDLSEAETANPGAYAVLFGDPKEGAPSLYELSENAGHFHYEVLCRIHKRVPRKYID